MNEEQNDDIQYVDVLWEDGSVIKCEIYDVIDFENKTYALLIPQDEDDEDTEVIVMEYVEDDEDNAHFQTIEDEDEFNRVCEYVKSFEAEGTGGGGGAGFLSPFLLPHPIRAIDNTAINKIDKTFFNTIHGTSFLLY